MSTTTTTARPDGYAIRDHKILESVTVNRGIVLGLAGGVVAWIILGIVALAAVAAL